MVRLRPKRKKIGKCAFTTLISELGTLQFERLSLKPERTAKNEPNFRAKKGRENRHQKRKKASFLNL